VIENRSPLRDVPFARLLLPALVIGWLAPRFLVAPADPGPAVRRAVEAVRGGPSSDTGRLEVQGLPDPDHDPADLLSRPEILAARARLLQKVEAENEMLTLRVADVARRLEPTPDDLVGLRLSGWLIPFYGRHAEALQRLADDGARRPWDALRALATTLEGRLEEPPEGVDLEISGQRRDLTRLFRDTDDALRTAETNVTEAVETFRRDALEAAAESAGPFRRRGRGHLLEIALAALLGATVRESVRRGPTAGGTAIRLSFAPALAIGVLVPLEGSPVLPVSPLRGVSLAFLPWSFAIGFVTGGLLLVASRLDRLFEAGDAAADADEAGHRAARGSERRSSSADDPVLDVRRPLRDRVRELAHEVMAATGEELRPEAPGSPGGFRTEREIPEETSPRGTLSEAAAARATERLPFARRRR